MKEHADDSERFIGGLSEEQRKRVVSHVEREFGWLTEGDILSASNLSRATISELLHGGSVLNLEIDGKPQAPAFTFHEGSVNPSIEFAVNALDPVMSDWEKLMWLCAGNGYLDGRRPVDVTLEEIKIAVEAELLA